MFVPYIFTDLSDFENLERSFTDPRQVWVEDEDTEE